MREHEFSAFPRGPVESQEPLSSTSSHLYHILTLARDESPAGGACTS